MASSKVCEIFDKHFRIQDFFDFLNKNQKKVYYDYENNEFYFGLTIHEQFKMDKLMICIRDFVENCTFDSMQQQMNDEYIKESFTDDMKNILTRLEKSKNIDYFNFFKKYLLCEYSICDKSCELKNDDDLCDFCKNFKEYHNLIQAYAVTKFLRNVVNELRGRWKYRDNNDLSVILTKCKEIYALYDDFRFTLIGIVTK